MKKIIMALCILVCVLALASCGSSSNEILHLGVNAVITEIDAPNKTIIVRDADERGILGEKCLIDCSEIPLIYCQYDTHQVKEISFDNLQVNDDVILSIRDSEIESYKNEHGQVGSIKIEQLQLGTQRIQ